MIFQLNGSEMLDWQETNCFECKHDHFFSHATHLEEGDGCDLMAESLFGADVPEFIDHDPHDGIGSIPALVECTAFEQCEAPECQGTETRLNRRTGEQQTHREWAAFLRAECLSHPVFEGAS